MKPEPLKGKMFYHESDNMSFSKFKCKKCKPKIFLEDVKSAVEWLRKQGQCNCSINYICYNCEIINEAFEDVMEE